MGMTSSQKMGIAAIMMAASVFLSRIMGLVRDKVVSWQFGAGSESDIYFTAFVVPDFLNHLLAGGYISITLIPLLSSAFKESDDDGWSFLGATLCWAFTGITVLTYVAFFFAPSIAPYIAPGFSELQIERLVEFLRIILPAQIFFITGSCLTAVLYVRRQFFVPALTPLIYNGCIILGGLFFPFRGMEGYCWGVLIGAFLGSFVLPLIAVRNGGFRFVPSLKHKKLWKLVLLALPLMLGLSVTVLDEQFVRIFGSMAGEGAVSLLNYARRIMMVPVGVVAQAAGVASFPFLAALAAKGDDKGFSDTMHKAVRGSAYVVIPLTFLLIAVANPVLGFLFEGGRFGSSETLLATPLLQIMMISVPFWTLHQIVSRAFYARQDTLTPAVVGTVVSLIALCMYSYSVERWGSVGVALCAACSIAVYTIALSVVWLKKFGTTVFDGLLGIVFRPSVLAVPACVVSLFIQQRMQSVVSDMLQSMSLGIDTFLLKYIMNGALGGSVFIALYAGCAYVWHRELLSPRDIS